MLIVLYETTQRFRGPAARQFNGSHVHPRYKNRLPLPILAARLHCNASKTSHEDGHDNGRDVVIAWVAGLDIGNTTTGALRCSIQVHTIYPAFNRVMSLPQLKMRLNVQMFE